MRRCNPVWVGTIRRRGRKGWSLQEMLVVIGIIMTLVALIAPTLSNIQEIRRRAICTTNNRGFARLCHDYAMAQGAGSRDPTQRLPVPSGRIDDPDDPDDQDNYLKIADATFQELSEKYGLEKEQAMCASLPLSVAPDSADSPFFDVVTGMASGSPPVPAVYMGLIYWGGRDHIFAPPPDPPPDPPEPLEVLYWSYRTKDLHKAQDPETDEWYEYSPTSNTLVSCMMFDVNANSSAADVDLDGDGEKSLRDCPENVSIMPHSRQRFETYKPDEEPKLSTGIAVGYTDGAVKWKEIDDLRSIDQVQRLWYDPQ